MLDPAKVKVSQRTISAVITRADGTVEDLGVIHFYHRNPLRRFAWRLSQFLKGLRYGVPHSK